MPRTVCSNCMAAPLSRPAPSSFPSAIWQLKKPPNCKPRSSLFALLPKPSSIFETMGYLLSTIGFAGKTAQEFFALLKEAGVERLIDIRQNRGGQLSGYAKHPDLPYFLQEIARITYVHEPLLAPAPELLKTYRKTKNCPAS